MAARFESTGSGVESGAGAFADAVYIRGLEFEANHGYTAAERRASRRFRVSLELHADLAAAAASDRIQDTIDYRRVSELVIDIGTRQTFRLLEGLAGAIGRAIQEIYPVELIIQIDKLAPPCPGVPESCGVRVRMPARGP